MTCSVSIFIHCALQPTTYKSSSIQVAPPGHVLTGLISCSTHLLWASFSYFHRLFVFKRTRESFVQQIFVLSGFAMTSFGKGGKLFFSAPYCQQLALGWSLMHPPPTIMLCIASLGFVILCSAICVGKALTTYLYTVMFDNKHSSYLCRRCFR